MKDNPQIAADLIKFLMDREIDIFYGIEDFDNLRQVFIELIGREPVDDRPSM